MAIDGNNVKVFHIERTHCELCYRTARMRVMLETRPGVYRPLGDFCRLCASKEAARLQRELGTVVQAPSGVVS